MLSADVFSLKLGLASWQGLSFTDCVLLLGIPFGLTSENENWQSYLKTIVGTCGGVESRQIDKRTDSEIVPSEVAQKFLILMIEFKDEQWKNLKPIKPYVLGKLRSGKAGCRFFPVAAKEFLSH